MLTSFPFLDTNIFLRHLRQDHADFSPRATAYLARVESGEIKVRTADTVVFETVYTLQRSYRETKADIRNAFLPLIELPGIMLPGKKRFRKVFSYYVDLNISFADAYHVVTMERLKIDVVVSFDRDFDRVPTIRRQEP